MTETEPPGAFSPNDQAYCHPLHSIQSVSSACGINEHSSLPHQPPPPASASFGRHYQLQLHTMPLTSRSHHHQVNGISNPLPLGQTTSRHEGAGAPSSSLAAALTPPHHNCPTPPQAPPPSPHVNNATRPQPRLRRFRHEITLCSPLRIHRRPASASFSRRNDNTLTSKQKAYASRVGLLWVTAAYDAPSGGTSNVLSRLQLCEQLARQFKCAPEVVAQHCPWLHCPEEFWRLNEHDHLVSVNAQYKSVLPAIPQASSDVVSGMPTRTPVPAPAQATSTIFQLDEVLPDDPKTEDEHPKPEDELEMFAELMRLDQLEDVLLP